MRRLKFMLFGIFVSPELLLLAVTLFFGIYFDEWVSVVGGMIRGNQEVMKYIPGFVVTMAGSVFMFSIKIRAPLEKGGNKDLYGWPMYNLLLDRLYVSYFYSAISGLGALVLLIAGSHLSSFLIFILSFGAVGVISVTAFTIFLAHQQIREIMEKCQS